MLYLIVLLTGLGLMVYCSLDILKTPRDQVRTLPKPLWLALVVAFPLIAALPWLLVGRPVPGAVPGRAATPRPPVRPVHPDDDEDFLRGLRERTEEQRRRAREQEPPPAT